MVPCAVCGAPSYGFHFQTEVCSACSAFFRRSVINEKEYDCTGEHFGCCEIASGLSNMCKCCRLTKCLAVGMNRELVQKRRDLNGKRVESGALAPFPSTFKVNKTALSILETIVDTYEKLESVRLCVHQNSVFSKQLPKRLNYKDTIAVYYREYYLMGDWLSHCFPDFLAFPDDQKDLLHRGFYLQFVILEGGFFACQRKRSDIRFLPSGDYIDCVNPETYYCDPDGQQTIRSDEAVKLFASSFQSYRRNVTHPMMRENADRFEFLALTGLALFDADHEQISESTALICRRNREKIQREMLKYYMSTMESDEATVRLGNLLSIIPNLHRATRRFLEDIELSHVMKAYSVDQKFYDNCIPKFGNF